jgi:fumarate hydratase class II
MSARTEWDSLGSVEVPADRLWGAQTQRALHHFAVSTECLPAEFLHALALVKQVCAQVNGELGVLAPTLAQAISDAADEVMQGHHPEQFPLRIWQSGSGTQTNMNMNEVLARLASHRLGEQAQDAPHVHPNDHVNRSQSSNDIIPTALQVSCVTAVQRLLPALVRLRAEIVAKARLYADLIKVGRTHLQDAVPMTVEQEWMAFEAQLALCSDAIERALLPVLALPVGGTAVGTGLNAPPTFGHLVCARLAAQVGWPFREADNKFAWIAAHDALVGLHGSLRQLAVVLMKLANDLRWLGSGPRCGLGELTLPANEPGSSIMPGKVNPSQCEMMMMVCTQVMGNDVTAGLCGAQGNLQLNTFKPLLAHTLLQSLRLLTDACMSFEAHCLQGARVDAQRTHGYVERSLMTVTALVPHVGYDHAARIAQLAYREGLTLSEAARAMGVDPEDVARWTKADQLVPGWRARRSEPPGPVSSGGTEPPTDDRAGS